MKIKRDFKWIETTRGHELYGNAHRVFGWISTGNCFGILKRTNLGLEFEGYCLATYHEDLINEVAKKIKQIKKQ